MGLEWIFFLALFTIGAIATGVLRLAKARAMTSGTQPGALSNLKLPSTNILIAVSVAAIGAIMLWSWWGVLTWWMLPVAIVLGYGGWAARKDEPVWSKRFFYWGAGALLLVSLLIIAFGKDEVANFNQQGLFDGPRPNAMGWTNIHGEFIIKHGLTPEKCVPAGYDAFDAEGNMFPFHQTADRGHKDCYENGIALVPNSLETTPDVSGFTPQGIMGWLTTTPAEKAAEEEAKEEKIDAANKRRSGTPAAPPIPKPVKEQECSGMYASAFNEGRLTTCNQVTLYRGGESFELGLSSNFCPGVTRAGAIWIEKVDTDGNGKDNSWILHPPTGASQATVEVYGVARGKEFRRNTCPDRT